MYTAKNTSLGRRYKELVHGKWLRQEDSLTFPTTGGHPEVQFAAASNASGLR
jgi:hypothetical protein